MCTPAIKWGEKAEPSFTITLCIFYFYLFYFFWWYFSLFIVISWTCICVYFSHFLYFINLYVCIIYLLLWQHCDMLHSHANKAHLNWIELNWVCVCVCVWERERESVCVCVCVWERERESVCVCVCVRERERVCVWERERERECVCVCERERERVCVCERERERFPRARVKDAERSSFRSITKPAKHKNSTINRIEIQDVSQVKNKETELIFLSLLLYKDPKENREDESCGTTLNLQYLCHQSLRKNFIWVQMEKSNGPFHDCHSY